LRRLQDPFARDAVSRRPGFSYSGFTRTNSRKDSTMSNLNHALEYNRMMETAKKRAVELRAEAIDDFWRDAGDAARRALRSATRLAHSMARHNRLRRNLEA
jgi:hypothetical protein